MSDDILEYIHNRRRFTLSRLNTFIALFKIKEMKTFVEDGKRARLPASLVCFKTINHFRFPITLSHNDL